MAGKDKSSTNVNTNDNTEVVTVENVEVQHEVQREVQREPRKRGASKDVINSLEGRIERLEMSGGELVERLDTIDDKLEELEAEDQALSDAFKGKITLIQVEFREEIRLLKERLDLVMAQNESMRIQHEEEVRMLKEQLEGAKRHIDVCMKAISNGVGPSTHAPRVDVPKPKGFSGNRDAKELDAFIWGMEQYFQAIKMTVDEDKVQTASLYLHDTAQLWWRRVSQEISKGTCSLTTWSDFVREIKRQFYPEHAELEAKRKLRKLRQTGTIQDYAKEYTTLALEIMCMSDEGLLFYFMDGLQDWANVELTRRDVQDLASAIAVAESLNDRGNREPTKPNTFKKSNSGKSGGDPKGQEHKAVGKEASKGKPKDKGKEKSKSRSTDCFMCGGPHFMRDCPQRSNLQAIVQHNEPNGDAAHMGSLHVLNSIEDNTRKGLFYVDVKVRGNTLKALVDTGASHNFMTKTTADELGLKLINGWGSIKSVNSEAKPMHDIARGVQVSIRD